MNPARRQFLQRILRHGAAAGLVAGTGALVVIRPGASPKPDCVRPLQCGRCARFGACALPKADRYRESKGGADGPLA